MGFTQREGRDPLYYESKPRKIVLPPMENTRIPSNVTLRPFLLLSSSPIVSIYGFYHTFLFNRFVVYRIHKNLDTVCFDKICFSFYFIRFVLSFFFSFLPFFLSSNFNKRSADNSSTCYRDRVHKVRSIRFYIRH